MKNPTEWQSLKKTLEQDPEILNALRQSGMRVTVWHGEGDTLYRVSDPKNPKKAQDR